MLSNQSAVQEVTRFISPTELAGLTGLSLVTIWRLRKRGELPEPARLSPGRVGWPVTVIRDWFDARTSAKAGGR